MIKIALIEVGHFHDECLYSQVQYLNTSDFELTLFCNVKLKPRIDNFQDVKEIVYLDFSTKLNKYKSMFQIWRRITKYNFSKIILNSAESNVYKLLKFPFPQNIEITGIIHNAQNLKNKGKQIAISKRIHKYFALNDFVKNNILNEKLTSNKVEAFYPIFFEALESKLNKPLTEVWITVPGAMDFNKRDYEALVPLKIPKHIKIIFLGSCNSSEAKRFLKEMKNAPIHSNLVFFDSFIDNELFFDYIKNSDYILPLIHPKNDSFKNFLKYKISGSYNLAFGFKIPLLMEQSFSGIPDFEENAIFYDSTKFEILFEKIKTCTKKMYCNSKWDFEYQRQKYTKFILNE